MNTTMINLTQDHLDYILDTMLSTKTLSNEDVAVLRIENKNGTLTATRIFELLGEREREVDEHTIRVEVDVAYEEGHSDGYEEGYDEGHSQGYDEGYDEGLNEGRDSAYEEGYQVGFDEGQESALTDN